MAMKTDELLEKKCIKGKIIMMKSSRKRLLTGIVESRANEEPEAGHRAASAKIPARRFIM